jgi:hypothetical protein
VCVNVFWQVMSHESIASSCATRNWSTRRSKGRSDDAISIARFTDIRELAEAIQAPPLGLTTDQLWQAYERLDRNRVRGARAALHIVRRILPAGQHAALAATVCRRCVQVVL